MPFLLDTAGTAVGVQMPSESVSTTPWVTPPLALSKPTATQLPTFWQETSESDAYCPLTPLVSAGSGARAGLHSSEGGAATDDCPVPLGAGDRAALLGAAGDAFPWQPA